MTAEPTAVECLATAPRATGQTTPKDEGGRETKKRRSKWEWVVLAAIAVVIAGWACWFNARQNARDQWEWDKLQAQQRRTQEWDRQRRMKRSITNHTNHTKSP